MLNRRDFFLGSAAFIASMSTSCRVLPLAGRQQGSLASQWLDVLQDIAGDEVERTIARPTVLSRQMAIPCTAMFDAWAAYDAKAVGTQANFQRRPEGQRTQANREKAISYAAYRTLYDVLPAAEDRAKLEKYMRQFGYDPADTSTDLNSGVGVGNGRQRVECKNMV